MATNWLASVPLTASGRPIFLPGETERCMIPAVDIDPAENPNLSPLRSGLLILTSHRILWIQESSTAFAIPLSAVIHVFSPKKSMFHSPRLRIQLADITVTVVMRGKNDPDVFYGKLLEAVRSRAWEEEVRTSVEPRATSSSSDEVLRVRMPVVGVSGILRKEQEQWENTDKSLQDAFQDLNALMSKAKEMVQLAEKMRLKLLSGSNSQGNQNDEEMGSKQEMQDWLLSVGIMSPVTKETAGALYHQQLSRQLADFVKVPLDKAGGMIALIDVYCLFNRARGTELISPEDLLRACALWEKFDVPVLLRKFESGVMVIQNKSHRDDEVFTRIESLAQRPDALRVGISASDAALTLGIAPALAKEQLLTAENKGILCRDVSPEGLRFYINLFREINPTDIYSTPTLGHFHAWISCSSIAG